MFNKTYFSRRNFIKSSMLGVAGISLFPGSITSCKGGGDLIKLGFIGIGQRAMTLLNAFIQIPGVRVTAGCDVYGVKRQRFENFVKKFYKKYNVTSPLKIYENFEDLVEDKNIDAVVIATPDHQHARIAIAACKAGKDVYLEKPVTFTIFEGQQLRKIVRETGRILAIGSQQRSDPNFQNAVRLVQSGKLGKIEKINAYVGAPPTPYNLPKEEIPEDLNWNLWLGPLSTDIYYNHKLDPPISLNPEVNEKCWGAWRWYKEMGGGYTTDWGAHMFDIAQWGLSMDESGPVEIAPLDDEKQFIKYTYSNGTIMTSERFNKNMKGVKFWGEKGWIEVSRGYFNSSDPVLLPGVKNKEEDKDENSYMKKIVHQINFIESVRKHKDPIVSIETGHRSNTVCCLGNIALDLDRTIKWDPVKEKFIDDKDGAATAKMKYKYRQGFSLL